jgi:hypothetical protein
MVSCGVRLLWMSLIVEFQGLAPEDMPDTSEEAARTDESFTQADRLHEDETQPMREKADQKLDRSFAKVTIALVLWLVGSVALGEIISHFSR